MGSFAVCADRNISIKTESKEKVAKKHGMILRVATSSGEERLHRVPDFNLVHTWGFKTFEGNQTNKTSGMER